MKAFTFPRYFLTNRLVQVTSVVQFCNFSNNKNEKVLLQFDEWFYLKKNLGTKTIFYI